MSALYCKFWGLMRWYEHDAIRDLQKMPSNDLKDKTSGHEKMIKIIADNRNPNLKLVLEFKAVRQESVRKKIQTLMQSCSFTSDIWTSLAHDGYINLNIHFIM